MKIEIEYDFMFQVYGANSQLILQREMLKQKDTSLVIYALYLANALASGKINEIPIVGSIGGLLIANALVSVTQATFEKEKDKKKSLEKLSVLAHKLNAYIKTSSELLKDSREYARDYELQFENGRLFLVQKKYIYVPTYDDGKIIYDKTSITQEHDIYIFPPQSNDKYVLSLGSPRKVLKPALSGI